MLARLGARLADRPDSEHEMSVNRFIFLVLMMLYLWVRPVPQQQWALVAMGCGLVLTLGLFAHILWRPGSNPVRRAIAFCADLSTISLMIHFTGDAGAIFYPLLLWTVLGNGFRFGIAWLVGSGVVALILFLVVVWATPFWRADPYLAAGMALGLVIIPGYAAVLIRRLDDARRAAEHANAAKTMFLATVSHQLRTPLNAIRGAQDALLGSPLTPDQREMIGIARAGADILLSNIEELIDFAQIESGHLRANPVTFELLALLGEVIDIARTLAQGKPLRFALHVDARCPLRLHGERRYLREILQNLLSNAVKFTQQGGVLLAVRPLDITHTTCRIECEVMDTGIGIAPEATERIFDSFTQANERILDEFGGTGLGLAICRRLATALSGSIGVGSVLGEGSRFWVDVQFELPTAKSSPEARREPDRCRVIDQTGGAFAARLARTAPDQAQAVDFASDARADAPTIAILSGSDALRAREPDHGPNIYYGAMPVTANGTSPLRDLRWHCASRLELDFTPDDWNAALAITRFPLEASGSRAAVVIPFRAKNRGIRVLVADDNKLNQRVVGKMLETAGFDVAFADNGDDALEVMDSGTVSVVLMDANMPVLNGIDATKHYRFAALDLPHLPIIGMSADATERMQQRCLEAGMDACITKPIDAQRLLTTIEHFITTPSADVAPGGREPASIVPLTRVGDREASLDEERLRELEALGGTGFVREMLSTLMADVETLTGDLQRAQGQNDLFLFRDVAHSIRSCAANLGAEPLARQAERLERLPAEMFARHGAADLRALVEQAARLRHDIGRRLAH